MTYSARQHQNQRFVARWAILLTCLLFKTNVVIAQAWSIRTADFRSQPATVTSFSETGVHFQTLGSNTDQTVALDDFLLMRRPSPAAAVTPGLFSLLLINGDRLSGEPISLQDDKLTWSSPYFGDMTLPISQLGIISRGNLIALPESPKQDTVVLSNQDIASGAIADLTKGIVTVQTETAAKSIPIPQIKSIAFAQTTSRPESHDSPAYRISLNDHSIFTARSVKLNGQQLEISPIDAGGQAIHVNLEYVASIEQMNGPVSWLSSHAPNENVQADYFGGSTQWPARFDLAVDGQPLVFDQHRYDYGIGVHAYSRLTFAIEPQWVGFRTQYAIHSPEQKQRPYADVTVRIKLDGKVVHEQTHLHEGTLSPVISLSINGGKFLTLECDYGENGDTQAAVNWLEPALLRTLGMEHAHAK